MANTEILKVLQLVREAKQSVNETLNTADGAAVKSLEALSTCLEEVEGDLIASALDTKIEELKDYRSQLETVNLQIQQDVDKLKAVGAAVDKAAKALGILIDVVSKAAELAVL